MSEFDFDLNEALKYISPSDLSYQEWVNVGMALKEEGYSVTVWDNWSANDTIKANVKRNGRASTALPRLSRALP